MSDSESSNGVVIPKYPAPKSIEGRSGHGVGVVKRDRFREFPRRQTHPTSTSAGTNDRTGRQSNPVNSNNAEERNSTTSSKSKNKVSRRRNTMTMEAALLSCNADGVEGHGNNEITVNKSEESAVGPQKNIELSHKSEGSYVEADCSEGRNAPKSKGLPIRRRKTMGMAPTLSAYNENGEAHGNNEMKGRQRHRNSTMTQDSKRQVTRRRQTMAMASPLPSYSPDYEVDRHAVQTNNSRNEPYNTDNNRKQFRKLSEPQHQHRPTSLARVQSSNQKRDPDIPSFLNIPINLENSSEGKEHNNVPLNIREMHIKEDDSPLTNECNQLTGGTLPLTQQQRTNSNHTCPLMTAASELEEMSNQLVLHLSRSKAIKKSGPNNQNNKNCGLKVPSTRLPHSTFPKRLLQVIRMLPGNDKCCDCGIMHSKSTYETDAMARLRGGEVHIGEKNKSWASVTYGIILCDRCAFRHITKAEENNKKLHNGEIMKSLSGGDWTLPDVITMLEGGNSNMIQYYCKQKLNNRISAGFENRDLRVIPTSLLESAQALKNGSNKNLGARGEKMILLDDTYSSNFIATYRKDLLQRVADVRQKY